MRKRRKKVKEKGKKLNKARIDEKWRGEKRENCTEGRKV